MNNERASEVGNFFSNYYKIVYDNYSNDTFLKISYELQFTKDLFSSINFSPINSNTQQIHHYLPDYGRYEDFKYYYENGFNRSKYQLEMYFQNDIFYELFKILKKIIIEKDYKFKEDGFNNLKNTYEEKKLTLNNYQQFDNYFNEFKIIIYKQSLNNVIMNILNMYCENYDDFIVKKQYNRELNNNINMMKNKCYNNGQNATIDLKNFDNNEINIKNLRNFLIWYIINILYSHYNDIYDMFLNHYNILNDCILLEKNVKKAVKKVVKKEVDIVINEPIIEIKKIVKKVVKKEVEVDVVINEPIIEVKNIEKKKKNKKKPIPPALKIKVWNKYIGAEIGKTKCLCCKLHDIFQASFTCGHIISEHCGGELKVNNLKPICSSCNSSMGIKNMNDYIKEFGF